MSRLRRELSREKQLMCQSSNQPKEVVFPRPRAAFCPGMGKMPRVPSLRFRLYTSILMLATIVGAAEWRYGSSTVAMAFFGVHVVTVLVLALLLALPLQWLGFPHGELLAKGGLYAKLYEMQFAEDDAAQLAARA